MKGNYIIKGFLPLFLFIIISSCKKEGSNIGLNLRNDGGSLLDSGITFTQIQCRTTEEDSVRTDSLNANLIGAIHDPLFGISRANFFCQPQLTEFGFNLNGATLDSVVLTLKFKRRQFVDGQEQPLYYGDLNSEISIDVHKLAEDLIPAERYYSNSVIAIGDQIGSYTGKLRFFDSVLRVSGGDTNMVGPELRIRLDASFGNEILSAPSSAFASNDAFLQFLKGIALIPDVSLNVNQGAMAAINFDTLANGITIYYNGDKSQHFPLTDESEHINTYDIVSQPADIVNQKSKDSGHFDAGYVQSMAGAKLKIDIADLASFIEQAGDVAILEARIEFPVQSGTVEALFPVPYRLLLFRPNPETGGNVVITDFIDDILPPTGWREYTRYGGRYSSSSNSYVFHFTRYLQGLIDTYNKTGSNDFIGFYLLTPSDFPITPARVMINNSPGVGPKVSVLYSKLN